MPLDKEDEYVLLQPAFAIIELKAELDATLTGLANQSGAGTPSTGGVGQIGSQSFKNVLAAAARADLKQTVEALQKFNAGHNKAFDGWENIAELRGGTGWENFRNEQAEASWERLGELLKWNMNEKISVAIANAEVQGLSHQIEQALQSGDYGRADELTADLAAAFVKFGFESVEIDVSGFFGFGAELFEGLGESGRALFDALIAGDIGGAPDETTVPEPYATPGTPEPYATPSSSGRPDTGGASSAQEAGVRTSADDSMDEFALHPENNTTSETPTGSAEETPAEEPADDPTEDPANGDVNESGSDSDGTTVLVKQSDGTYKDTKTGAVYTKEELEETGVDVEATEQQEGAQDTSAEDAETEDAETEDATDDGTSETPETDGYTPGHDDDRGAPIAPEQVAKAAARTSSGNLKLYDESYTGPSPMGDVAKAFGDHVDSLLFDMVSRPSDIDDDPIIPEDADPLGEILDKEKELWAPNNPLGDPGTETRGDPVPEDPFDIV